jgi:hypothetical protein
MDHDVESLRAELAELRAELAEVRGAESSAMTRRRLLATLAGLGAAGAAGMAAAPPAGAAEAAVGGQVLFDAALDEHINDPTDAHLASAIGTTPTGDLTATTVQASLSELDARITQLPWYRPGFLSDWVMEYDDFLNGSVVASGQIGKLGWSSQLTGTGVVMAPALQVVNMHGWVAVQGTALNDTATLRLDGFSFDRAPAFFCHWRVAMAAINSGSHSATWWVGFHNGAGTEPTNGFYFRYTSADTTLHARTRVGGGTPTDVDTNYVVAANTPMNLVMISDGGGAVYFFINPTDWSALTPGNAVATINATMPGAGALWGPRASLLKTLGSGTNRVLRVDLCHFGIAVTR